MRTQQMGKTGSKNMTSEDFRTIRLLVEAGLESKHIKLATGRSLATIDRVKNSKDFDEYKELTRQQKSKYEREALPTLPVDTNKKGYAKDNVPAPLNQYEASIPTRNARSLERIADGIERLARAWETEPKRRSIF